MKKLTLLSFFAFLFIASPVIADDIYVYGDEIFNACNEAVKYLNNKGEPDAFQSGICWGYLAGANDMHELMDHGEDAPHHCKPENKDISELARAVVKYLKNNPGKTQTPAPMLIFDAFHEVFPCGKDLPPT